MKGVKSGHFCIQPDTPTHRRRSACLGVELRLGDELKSHLFSVHFSDLFLSKKD